MDKIYKVIDLGDISDGSKALYKRQIKKLYDKLPKKTITILKDVPLIQKTIEEIYTNKESQRTIYSAVILIARLYKGIPKSTDEEYRKIRDELVNEIRDTKGNNIVEDMNKWMSLEELKAVPTMIQQEIEKKYGSLFLSSSAMSQLKKADRIKYVKLFLKWGFIYIVINHPLRLDYFNLPLTKTDSNYMLRDHNTLTLYLNKFKNVRSMGPQTIEYNDPMILKYLDQLEVIMGSKPTHLLWMVLKNEVRLFSRQEVYSHHITNIIKAYTGKHISNNTIRKIHESNLIQSPDYHQMTNKEKTKAHAKLLHSANLAHGAYNKIVKKEKKLCKCCGQVIQ